ncbi:MAG: ATP-binding protein [Pseudomonadota bacterium]
MKRLVLTGPESTGKTSLVRELAIALNAPVVSEFARDYLDQRPSYLPHDLHLIAQGQYASEQAVKTEHPTAKICVIDTDIQVIRIWWRFRYGPLPAWLQEMSKVQHSQSRHYLICRPDLVWEEDPLRENKDDRDMLFDQYLEDADKRSLSFDVVQGHGKKRLSTALEFVRRITQILE